jgi:hypothetical protein
MSRIKYIMFDDNSFVIFSSIIVHSDIRTDKVPVSAGFLVALPCEGGFVCAGESDSLGLKAREEDTEIINRDLLV